MEPRYLLIPLLLAFVGIAAASTPLPLCDPALRPTTLVAPQLPRLLHNEFEGTILVEVTILASGEVGAAQAVSTPMRPIGRSSGEPTGYAEAAIAAAEMWRFLEQSHPCQHEIPFTIEFSGHATD